jgi:hypothetical protein
MSAPGWWIYCGGQEFKLAQAERKSFTSWFAGSVDKIRNLFS